MTTHNSVVHTDKQDAVNSVDPLNLLIKCVFKLGLAPIPNDENSAKLLQALKDKDVDVLDDETVKIKIDVLNSLNDFASIMLKNILSTMISRGLEDGRQSLYIQIEDDWITLSTRNQFCSDIEKIVEDYLRSKYHEFRDEYKVLPIIYFEISTHPRFSNKLKEEVSKRFQSLESKVVEEIRKGIGRPCISSRPPSLADVISLNIMDIVKMGKNCIAQLVKTLIEPKTVDDVVARIQNLYTNAAFYKIIDEKYIEYIVKNELRSGRYVKTLYEKLAKGDIRWGSVYMHLLNILLEPIHDKLSPKIIPKIIESMDRYGEYLQSLAETISRDPESWLTTLNDVLEEIKRAGKNLAGDGSIEKILYPILPALNLVLIYNTLVTQDITKVLLLTKFECLLEHVKDVLRKDLQNVVPDISDVLEKQLTSIQFIDDVLLKLISILNAMVSTIDYKGMEKDFHVFEMKITRNSLLGEDLGEVVVKLGSFVILIYNNSKNLYIVSSPASKKVMNMIETLNRLLHQYTSLTYSAAFIEYPKKEKGIDLITEEVISNAVSLILGIENVDLRSLRIIYSDQPKRRLIIAKFNTK